MRNKLLACVAVVFVAVSALLVLGYSDVSASVRTLDAVEIKVSLGYWDLWGSNLDYREALYLSTVDLGVADIYRDEAKLKQAIKKNTPGVILYVRAEYPDSFLDAIQELENAR